MNAMNVLGDSRNKRGTRLLYLGRWIAICWAVFQIYNACLGFFDQMVFLPIHVGAAMAVVFCTFPIKKDVPKERTWLLDLILCFISLSIPAYVILNLYRITTRMTFVDSVNSMDVFFGLCLVVLLIEASRRAAGIAFTTVGVVFIAYFFLGPLIPSGFLNHRGITFERFCELQLLSLNGIFSLPIRVSAEVVFYFILFGAFLEQSGGGQMFNDIAYSVTGRLRGGAAKASVISSALFGMISGSAVANVVVDGIFTIPLMKKTGFSPTFSSAVEATASTGGQIMPPVMGAGAFLMAQILGIPYAKIVVAAAIPAVLYYVSLYFTVDLKALKEGIRAIPKENMPDVKGGLFKRGHLLIPLVVLVWAILTGYTIYTAALYAIGATVIVSLVSKITRMNIKKILEAMDSGAKQASSIAVPSAMAGIIVGVVVHSGLSLKFSGLVIGLSANILPLALFWVMIACLILGMGMPTSAAYIIAATLLAPALIGMGIEPLAAHLFIFYFAVISMITPPVAMAAYAAAAIGKCSMWLTGLEAFKMSLGCFLIPFVFVYNTSMLCRGPIIEILWVSMTAAVGVYILATANIGYWRTSLKPWERIISGIAAISLIIPIKVFDIIGLTIIILLFFVQRRRSVQASLGHGLVVKPPSKISTAGIERK